MIIISLYLQIWIAVREVTVCNLSQCSHYCKGLVKHVIISNERFNVYKWSMMQRCSCSNLYTHKTFYSPTYIHVIYHAVVIKALLLRNRCKVISAFIYLLTLNINVSCQEFEWAKIKYHYFCWVRILDTESMRKWDRRDSPNWKYNI